MTYVKNSKNDTQSQRTKLQINIFLYLVKV